MPSPRPLHSALVAGLVLAAAVLLACGSDDEGGGEAEGPEVGVSVELEPVRGEVSVRESGEGFEQLDDVAVLPVGSEVDASDGVVRLTSARTDGDTQEGEFSEGRFEIAQEEGSDTVTLKLTGGDFSECDTPKARRDRSTVGGPRIRSLFAEGEGDFRTEGQFASASTRGTTWETVDACFGTLTDVADGEVVVSDKIRGREIPVSAGEDLWIAERP